SSGGHRGQHTWRESHPWAPPSWCGAGVEPTSSKVRRRAPRSSTGGGSTGCSSGSGSHYSSGSSHQSRADLGAGTCPGLYRISCVAGPHSGWGITVNELRAILADVVTRLFTERVTREVRESAESGAWPDALWTAVEENGLTLPLVPEGRGGAGGTWGDAYIAVRAAGRHAVPIPLPETIIAAWRLAGADLEV